MTYDVVIIGAGIVGLSVGYNFKKVRPDLSIAIVEKENTIAFHQTGRNSGVIHSGIYYKPGSAKAINCKEGYDLMLDFCVEHKIEHEICGKLIVATNKDEEQKLQDIYQRGLENGLVNLKILDSKGLRKIEPYVKGTKAILVPQAGIVSYKKVADKLKEILESSNVHFLLGSKVQEISNENGVSEVICEDLTIKAQFLVNCAGLYADKIARMNNVVLDARIIPFRGEYYVLKDDKKYLVNNLVYPVPNPSFPFLGVHFTRRINGVIDAGPNAVLAFKREGYRKLDFNMGEFVETVSYKGFLKVAFKFWKVGFYEMYRSFSKKAFVRALQKLIPEINSKDLIVGDAGVRAQLCDSKGNLVDDFLIKYVKNQVHVINAPSPAATSSLQIGKSITEEILKISFIVDKQ